MLGALSLFKQRMPARLRDKAVPALLARMAFLSVGIKGSNLSEVLLDWLPLRHRSVLNAASMLASGDGGVLDYTPNS